MIKKVVLIVLILILVLAGCTAKQENTSREVIWVDVPLDAAEKDAVFEALDEMSIIPDTDEGGMTVEKFSYDSLTEDELRIRFVIEALNISQEHGRVYKNEELLKKFGVSDRYYLNELLELGYLEEFIALFSNSEFAEIFYEQSGYRIEEYYLPLYADGDKCFSYSGTVKGDFYFLIGGEQITGDTRYLWYVIDVKEKASAKEVAELNSGNVKAELTTEMRDGTEVYYFYGNSLSYHLLLPSDFPNRFMIYTWEQDGVVGTILIEGEHKDEYLDLCVLEKHEL